MTALGLGILVAEILVAPYRSGLVVDHDQCAVLGEVETVYRTADVHTALVIECDLDRSVLAVGHSEAEFGRHRSAAMHGALRVVEVDESS